MEFYLNRDHLLTKIDYPARYHGEKLMKTAAVVFGFILLFLLLFTPFGVNGAEQRIPYFFICCLHALSPALILYLYFSIRNYAGAKSGQTISWTLLREYKQIGTVLLLNGFVSFLMRDLIYYNNDNWSFYYLWIEVRNCLIAGSSFYFFMRLAEFYFLSKKGAPFVLQFTSLQEKTEKPVAAAVVFIKTQVKQDDFELPVNDLLFVKAEGNYVQLTLWSNNRVTTELKRISLTQLETQLAAFSQLFRCHRAYLINMLQIATVSGNSQGYLVAFSSTELKVPVSRTQLDGFNSRYQQLRQTIASQAGSSSQ